MRSYTEVKKSCFKVLSRLNPSVCAPLMWSHCVGCMKSKCIFSMAATCIIWSHFSNGRSGSLKKPAGIIQSSCCSLVRLIAERLKSWMLCGFLERLKRLFLHCGCFTSSMNVAAEGLSPLGRSFGPKPHTAIPRVCSKECFPFHSPTMLGFTSSSRHWKRRKTDEI